MSVPLWFRDGQQVIARRQMRKTKIAAEAHFRLFVNPGSL